MADTSSKPNMANRLTGTPSQPKSATTPSAEASGTAKINAPHYAGLPSVEVITQTLIANPELLQLEQALRAFKREYAVGSWLSMFNVAKWFQLLHEL